MRHHFSKLKSHRKRSGLTQEELRFLLGVKKHSTISRYETGERTPDLKTALAYQAMFGAGLRELFPDLAAQVETEVTGRAHELSQQIMRAGESRAASYKIARLRRLATRREERRHAV